MGAIVTKNVKANTTVTAIQPGYFKKLMFKKIFKDKKFLRVSNLKDLHLVLRLCLRSQAMEPWIKQN